MIGGKVFLRWTHSKILDIESTLAGLLQSIHIVIRTPKSLSE